MLSALSVQRSRLDGSMIVVCSLTFSCVLGKPKPFPKSDQTTAPEPAKQREESS
jgi:hypothetical protein